MMKEKTKTAKVKITLINFSEKEREEAKQLLKGLKWKKNGLKNNEKKVCDKCRGVLK